MDNFRKYIPYILIFVLIIAGVAAYFLLKSPNQNGTQNSNANINSDTGDIGNAEENLTNVDPDSVTAAAKENYALGKEKALFWHSDAVFVAASLKMNTIALNDANETYVFDSPTDPQNHFVFTISQKSKRFIRAIIPADDYLGAGLLPIDGQYWKLSYAAALQTAEKEGGADFRDKTLDWEIELTLRRDAPNNWLYWIVEYKQKSGEGNSLTVKINSNNGEVVTE